MATGDAAAAAGMDLVSGSSAANTLDTEDNKTRDYIAGGPDNWTSGKKVPISKGGTNATDAATALTNLGALPASDVYSSGSVANKVPRYDGSGRLIVASPSASNHAAPKVYVDAEVSDVNLKGGGTVNGDLTVSGSGHHLYVTAAVAATSGFTSAYINGDGRLSKGASSRRFKKFISAILPSSLGNIFPQLQRYQMRSGDGVWRYGYIAEDLAAHPDLERFVVYETTEDGKEYVLDGDGHKVPESIDFIGLLVAQNAQLHERLQALEEAISDDH